MSRNQQIFTLIILPILGAVFACLLIFLLPKINTRFFVKWQPLGSPPEKAVKILAIADDLWIQANSGKVYRYVFTADSSCENDNCWVSSDGLSIPASRELLPLEICGSFMPTLPKEIDSKAVCDRWGVGGYLRVYAINIDGGVFVWEHGIGGDDGMQLITWPCTGALIALLLGILIVPMLSQRRPTQRAPDGWESARFQAGCWLEVGSGKAASPPPAHPRVTLPVGCLTQQQ